MKVNAEKIKELRKRHGWSQEHLANAAGVGLRTVQRVESKSSGSRETMLCIAAAFEVSFDELSNSENVEQAKSKDTTANPPQNVSHAVIAIYLSIFISAMTTLVNKLLGDITMEDFITLLIVEFFMCIFPYKIHNRSNATRYLFLVLSVFSYFLILGGYEDRLTESDFISGLEKMTELDLIIGLVCIPLDIFIFYKLFNPISNRWFSGNSGKLTT